MKRKERVVVVGGGITGLTTAYALEKAGDDVDVVVLEASSRLGGNIVTQTHQGFTIDGGPDSWVATKPYATALAKELGLGDELIATIPENRKVYIAHEGRLHPMPEGVMLGVPTEVRPIVESELFTWDAKLRMGLELVVPRRLFQGDRDDETVSSFLQRRFGDQLADRLAGPLLGGIFAGEADAISIRAAFPQLVAAEREHGSLIVAMRKQMAARRAASASKTGGGSAFLSLKRGMGDLVVNLAHRISSEILTDTKVLAVTSTEPGDPRGRFRVFTRGRPRMFADHVVLTGPAHATRPVLEPLSPAFATAFDGFDYSSTATVFLAYKRKDIDHPLDASGYIVPRSSGRAALASTWIGSKWENRVPGGQALLRVFFGGDGREDLLTMPDDELARLAEAELGAFLKITGKPLFFRTFRYNKASPQPRVGHLARMAELRKHLASFPGLYVAGNGYDGIGIPECIRQAREVAATIRASRVPVDAAHRPTDDALATRASVLPPGSVGRAS